MSRPPQFGGLVTAPSVILRADTYRQHAYECRQQAEQSRSPADKDRWLTIAEHWLMLAQEAETDQH